MTRPMRWAGAAAAGTAALALLVAGCVFAAMAGPALSLHTRTQALRQTLAGLASADKTVQMTSGLADFTNPNGYSEPLQQQQLTRQQLEDSAAELGGGLAAAGVPLAAGAWAGLTTRLLPVASGAGPGAQAGTGPELEVVYRDRLPGYAGLAAGSYSGTAVPAGAVAVAVTGPTAARFGLRPRSVLTLATASGTVKLVVTGIVRQRDPGSAFWTLDPTVAAPSLNTPPQRPSYWAGGVFADPGQLGAMQDAFGAPSPTLDWVFPLAVGGVTADQAQALADDLNRVTTAAPALAGQFQAASGTVMVTSPLISDLAVFLAAQSAVETVLLLLFVSLALVGVAVVMLAARMIVAARDGELTTLRA
ncbi:MAG: hypothetical protein JO132_15810, partial [Streptosporangiaceae bacterium]|nr:hypothetical protein [Streptosporangiaceae bacterium]